LQKAKAMNNFVGKRSKKPKVMVIKMEEIDTSLRLMRLMRPRQVNDMVQSMSRFGQLQPIIVRPEAGKYQLIDGFKRYYAGQEIQLVQLEANVAGVSEAIGKAMIVNCNKEANSLVEYEEALIVYSLVKDHLMEQKEIATLLGYSRTWVCRRIAMIEKLDQVVQDELRLGAISNTQARSIIKLPRGNQEEIVRAIIGHQLNSRQSKLLVDKYLQTGNKQEQAYLLEHPQEVLNHDGRVNEIYDCRLSPYGNRLLKTTEILRNQQDMFVGQFINHQASQLKEPEKAILWPKIEQISKKSHTIISVINQKTG
jgi:ParB/RepB/Spo0J family partition protein